jgi:hypothetical protein
LVYSTVVTARREILEAEGKLSNDKPLEQVLESCHRLTGSNSLVESRLLFVVVSTSQQQNEFLALMQVLKQFVFVSRRVKGAGRFKDTAVADEDPGVNRRW